MSRSIPLICRKRHPRKGLNFASVSTLIPATLACLLAIAGNASAEVNPSFGPPPPGSSPGVIAIVGGTLIDGASKEPKTGYTILVEGKTIKKIAPVDEVQVPSGSHVIDASGMTVMPGLINSNGHVSLNPLYPGPASDLPLDELKQRWKEMGGEAEKRAYVELMQGVTTIRHTGGSYRPANVAELKKRIDRGEIPGPRLYFSGGLIQSKAAFDAFIKENHTPEESLDYVRNQWVYHVVEDIERDLQPILSEDYPYWKLYFSHVPFDGANDFTDAQVKRIIEMARAHGKKIDVHANDSNPGFKRLLEFDIDSIEHPFAKHFIIDQETLERIAEKGIIGVSLIVQRTAMADIATDPNRLAETDFIMSMPPDEYRLLMHYRDKMLFNKRNPDREGLAIYEPNLSESDMFGQHGPSFNQFVKQRETVLENARRWIAAGGRIAMGTDGTTFLNFQQRSPVSSEMIALVELGMTPMEVILSATRTGAELLGMEDRIGTVEVGKLADIIVVEGDPLENMAAMHRVAYVIKDGVRFK